MCIEDSAVNPVRYLLLSIFWVLATGSSVNAQTYRIPLGIGPRPRPPVEKPKRDDFRPVWSYASDYEIGVACKFSKFLDEGDSRTVYSLMAGQIFAYEDKGTNKILVRKEGGGPVHASSLACKSTFYTSNSIINYGYLNQYFVCPLKWRKKYQRTLCMLSVYQGDLLLLTDPFGSKRLHFLAHGKEKLEVPGMSGLYFSCDELSTRDKCRKFLPQYRLPQDAYEYVLNLAPKSLVIPPVPSAGPEPW